MSDDLELPPLEDLPLTPAGDGVSTGAGGPGPALPGGAGVTELERLTDVLVELAVEVGRTRMTLGETLALGPGSVVTLERLADQPVDLLVNGRPIARGEVVVIDEQFGLRITEVIGAEPLARTHSALPAAPAAVLPAPA
ncbi:MAG: fliN [Conexibacter sp.]|jgi:flagellar motor switch protein FliN/FliY|nr:fliN [Conexibacter sp.]